MLIGHVAWGLERITRRNEELGFGFCGAPCHFAVAVWLYFLLTLTNLKAPVTPQTSTLPGETFPVTQVLEGRPAMEQVRTVGDEIGAPAGLQQQPQHGEYSKLFRMGLILSVSRLKLFGLD